MLPVCISALCSTPPDALARAGSSARQGPGRTASFSFIHREGGAGISTRMRMSWRTTTFPEGLVHTATSRSCDCPRSKATRSSWCALSFFSCSTTVFRNSKAPPPLLCSDCQCLELCPLKERRPLQMDLSEAMLSSSHPAPTVTAAPPCPAKPTSVDLSCGTEQLLSRNIYLVRWCDFFAIAPVVRFPGCLLVLQGLAACQE